MINVGLKHMFQPIISYLYQIRVNEGISLDEGCMENSHLLKFQLQRITIVERIQTPTTSHILFLYGLVKMISS